VLVDRVAHDLRLERRRRQTEASRRASMSSRSCAASTAGAGALALAGATTVALAAAVVARRAPSAVQMPRSENTGPAHRITPRSITFCSSRTLPGHE
jgi:hypothetical protein